MNREMNRNREERLSEMLKDFPIILDYLLSHNFCEQPAAMKYHGAYAGGLFDHSMAVVEEIQKMTDALGLQWQRKESPVIIGLLHDICKLDDYTCKYREEADMTSIDIRWNTEQTYGGHGEKSLIMALDAGIELTQEEKNCIWYHMGAFVPEKQWQHYTDAVKRFPNLLYVHTADMIASQVRGI